ncbi:hypothetical protein WN943_019394 [Citrus x changshan-huyou]
MARETSPGLKILWVWTIGTAASTQLTHSLCFLVTNVVRTRVRDMEQVMNSEKQEQQSTLDDSVLVDTSPETDEGIIKEVKTCDISLIDPIPRHL